MSRFWGRRVTEDVDDEFAFHRDMRIQDYLSRGMSAAEARARAAARLGDLAAARDTCLTIGHRRHRRMRRSHMFDALKQDLRFAMRTLTRQPGWTAVALLTLALGVGATTAVYSVVNGLMLNPIRYPGGDRVVMLMSEFRKGSGMMMSPRPEALATWQKNARTFEAIEPFRDGQRTLFLPGTDPATVDVAAVGEGFAAFVGVRPIIGRGILASDGAAGAPPVLVLGERTWRQRFGGSEGVLGTLVTLDEVSYQVVGVMPDVGLMPRQIVRPEFWLALPRVPENISWLAMGRLAPGSTVEAAQAELDALQSTVESPLKDLHTQLMRPSDLTGLSSTLRMLALAVVLVLLIACANVAHLLLARGATRERELAIRVSLGAERARIFRQLLTESLLLTVGGSLAGLALGWLSLQAMIHWRPPTLDELAGVRFDTTVVGAALLLALVTGTVFGVMGMLQLRRKATQESLRSGAVSVSAGRSQRRLRGALLVTEMALSATLLVGTSLLVRSILHLQHTDPGFQAEGLHTAQFVFPASATTAARELSLQQIAARLATVPGVEGVTVAEGTPPDIGMMFGSMHVEGEPEVDERSALLFNSVAPEYFALLQIPLRAGTTFTDTTAAAGQVIVNEGMARAHWGDGSAIGRRLQMSKGGPWMTIVGVVGDVTGHGLIGDRKSPMIYTPRNPGEGGEGGTLVIRYSGSGDLTRALRALAREIDPRLPPAEMKSVTTELGRTIARPQFTTRLLLSFAVLALVLAAVGLYGVMAYTVAQRTREIGIRMALGASRRQILASVLGNGLALTVMGIGAGLIGAVWASQLLSGLLYGVSKGDPLSFLAGGLVLVLSALVATLVPARRALAIAPVEAIRSE